MMLCASVLDSCANRRARARGADRLHRRQATAEPSSARPALLYSYFTLVCKVHCSGERQHAPRLHTHGSQVRCRVPACKLPHTGFKQRTAHQFRHPGCRPRTTPHTRTGNIQPRTVTEKIPNLQKGSTHPRCECGVATRSSQATRSSRTLALPGGSRLHSGLDALLSSGLLQKQALCKPQRVLRLRPSRQALQVRAQVPSVIGIALGLSEPRDTN